MKRVACNLFPICCPSPNSTQEQTLVKPDRLLLTPTHWKYIHQPFKIQSPQIVVDESDTSRVFSNMDRQPFKLLENCWKLPYFLR